MQSTNTQRVYFKNLDGLRFLAAFFVMLVHIAELKFFVGDGGNATWVSHLRHVGDEMVTLFFVLSGFLITYLLLKEKEETSTISVKEFYAKRMLRIWPLYYIVGILGFFVFPHLGELFHHIYAYGTNTDAGLHALLYALFLNPHVMSKFLGVTWSIRVEEVFYIFWPLILKRTKQPMKLFIAIVAFGVLLKICSLVLMHTTPNYFFADINHKVNDYRFGCMAMGGIAAYLYLFDKKKILSVLYRKDVQWAVYIVTVALLILNIEIPVFHYDVSSVLYALIVLNLATNPGTVISLNHPWMNYLGKISYGIYMFHPIMRVFSMELVEDICHRPISGLHSNLLYYAATIASTIIVASLSYKFFETPLIKMKKYLIASNVKVNP